GGLSPELSPAPGDGVHIATRRCDMPTVACPERHRVRWLTGVGWRHRQDLGGATTFNDFSRLLCSIAKVSRQDLRPAERYSLRHGERGAGQGAGTGDPGQDATICRWGHRK
ncbi:MAG: hypothetical protein AAGE83_08540, partial [Pseudomonadota bacterium]